MGARHPAAVPWTCTVGRRCEHRPLGWSALSDNAQARQKGRWASLVTVGGRCLATSSSSSGSE